MSTSRLIITASRLYDLLLDVETTDRDELDRPALRKALRLGYLRPARFADAPLDPKGYKRPCILAYTLTPEGLDFIHRHEDADAIARGTMVDAASGWESLS